MRERTAGPTFEGATSPTSEGGPMFRPTYAGVTATLALFIALGGGAYAAATLPANSVGAKQLKKNAVQRSKLKANAVDGSKVLDGSLTGADVKESTLEKVPSAATADAATNATNATTATNATNATNATHAAAVAALDKLVYRAVGASAPVGATNGASAGCDPGMHVIGGGVKVEDTDDAFVIDEFPDAGNTVFTARVGTVSDAPGPVNFTVYAICAAASTV